MTCDELIRQLEDCTLPPAALDHRAHVQAGFAYLQRHGYAGALSAMATALSRFAGHHGKAGLYHETITAAFLALNPFGQVPVLDDGGTVIADSNAILVYLASKTGQLIPADTAGRFETLQWVMFQMGGIGPMFGQVGFFHKFAGKAYEDKRPRDRYATESARLLGVLDERLAGRDWVMGADYSIADISLLGWVRNLIGFYGARDLVAFDTLKQVPAWLERGLARPAVQRGLEIPKRP